MKAEIIAVGSELLTPDRLDTNSLFLTAELNKLGIEVTRKCVVGDKREDVREAFAHGLSRSDVTISTGGLGPTEDDLTREVVADLLGRKLESNVEVLRAIEQRDEDSPQRAAQRNRHVKGCQPPGVRLQARQFPVADHAANKQAHREEWDRHLDRVVLELRRKRIRHPAHRHRK